MKGVIYSMLFVFFVSCNSYSKKDLQEHYKQVADNAVRWNDYGTAATAWQSLYQLDRTNAPLLDSVFYAFTATNNAVAAASIGNEIVRAHTQDTAFLYALTDMNKRSGNFGPAIEVIKLNMALTGDSLPGMYDIAACYFELGDMNSAVQYLNSVIQYPTAMERMANVSGEEVPYVVAALNVVGVAAIRLGNISEAEKVLLEALKLAPNFSLVRNNLQMLRNQESLRR